MRLISKLNSHNFLVLVFLISKLNNNKIYNNHNSNKYKYNNNNNSNSNNSNSNKLVII